MSENYMKHLSLFDNSIQYECSIYKINVYHNESGTITNKVFINKDISLAWDKNVMRTLLFEVSDIIRCLTKMWRDVCNDIEMGRWENFPTDEKNHALSARVLGSGVEPVMPDVMQDLPSVTDEFAHLPGVPLNARKADEKAHEIKCNLGDDGASCIVLAGPRTAEEIVDILRIERNVKELSEVWDSLDEI